MGIVASVVFSFVVITLIASYYRFQNIVQLAEEMQPEEMGAKPEDILRVQLARYLAGCARRGTSFSISLIRISNPEVPVRMDAPVMGAIKRAARHGDVTCVFDDRTVVLFTETEPEDSVSILTRITARIADDCAKLALDDLRTGIASYPGHGLSGKDLIKAALEGLEATTASTPIVMPEIVDYDEDDDEEDADQAVEEAAAEAVGSDEGQHSKGWRERRKNSMIDELTNVLKPEAISPFMQRVMSEFRRKKQRAALFCVGVNNMEHIARFHGQEAADDVLRGVSQVLQDNLRAEDLIGRHEKYAFLVLAECSIAEAEIIGKRISTLVSQGEFVSGRKKLKTTITLGVATFPEHGRNLHQLYTAGQKVLDHSRSNDIRAYAVYDPDIHDKVPAKPMKNIKSVQA
ncbi:diguanylate cyclase domain-containing protein [Pontiella sp.]|uniref:diguanylate cyclase domain-containing protein n=1 Tax=Pontiella sp. TaxID=2837462 RepID=UPI003564AC29